VSENREIDFPAARWLAMLHINIIRQDVEATISVTMMHDT